VTGPAQPPGGRPRPAPPTQGEVEQRDAFGALARTSLERVQASAERWRTGLAALVALVTAGLFAKGPGAAAELPARWRLGLTAGGGVGLALAVIGLWLALAAGAGLPRRRSLGEIAASNASVLHAEVVEARRAARHLAAARLLLLVSLAVLGGTGAAWTLAPVATPMVEVEIDGDSLCGELLSADDQEVRLQRDGVSDPDVVAFADVQNIRVGADC